MDKIDEDKLNYNSYKVIHDDMELALLMHGIPLCVRLTLMSVRNRAYNMMQAIGKPKA